MIVLKKNEGFFSRGERSQREVVYEMLFFDQGNQTHEKFVEKSVQTNQTRLQVIKKFNAQNGFLFLNQGQLGGLEIM
jgi:hypothetical protein